MKSNSVLQATLNFSNEAQKVWYAAHVLKAALLSSPAITVRKAVPAVAAKAEVIAQTAKPARAATAAVTAAANTVGYAFGELYLNSPAYPIGVAIPAIPAKVASNEVVGIPAVPAVPAITPITVPAYKGLPGWEGSVSIELASQSDPTRHKIGVYLPYADGALVGSDVFKILEITSPTLQATAWMDAKANPNPVQGTLLSGVDLPTETVEQFLYRNALFCEHTITDELRMVGNDIVKCKYLEIFVYHDTFNTSIPSIHLDLIQPLPVNLGS